MRQVLLRPGNARTLAMLGVVTVLMVALAAFAVSMQRRALTSSFETRLMFPELGQQVNEATRVEIVHRTSKVTVVRDAEQPDLWRIEEKGNYPAKTDLVKRTVVGLADLELVEARTAQAEWHKHINLTAPEDKGSGVRVKVYGAEGEELAGLIAGKLEGSADIDGEGTIYVRRVDDDQSYVARGSFNLEQNPVNWLETGVIDLEKGRVVRVDVTPAEGEAYAVEIADGEQTAVGPAYRLHELDEALQPVTDYAITGIGNALAGLAFQDAVAAADVTLAAPVASVFTTKDGLMIKVAAEKQDKVYYAKLDASAVEGADEAVVAEAQRLSARLSPYAYAIPTAKGADLTRTLDVLVEAKPEVDTSVDLEAVVEGGVAP